HRRGGPERNAGCVQSLAAEAVDQHAHRQQAEEVRPQERREQVAHRDLGEAKFLCDRLRCYRQRHAVHVVDHGQREQKDTDPTSPPAQGAPSMLVLLCATTLVSALAGMLSRGALLRQANLDQEARRKRRKTKRKTAKDHQLRFLTMEIKERASA